MSAFLGDEGFQRSLEDAWRTARPPKLDGAVLWSLTDGDGPVDHVSDSSFGAAFATAFQCKSGDPMVRGDDKRVVIW